MSQPASGVLNFLRDPYDSFIAQNRYPGNLRLDVLVAYSSVGVKTVVSPTEVYVNGEKVEASFEERTYAGPNQGFRVVGRVVVPPNGMVALRFPSGGVVDDTALVAFGAVGEIAS